MPSTTTVLWLSAMISLFQIALILRPWSADTSRISRDGLNAYTALVNQISGAPTTPALSMTFFNLSLSANAFAASMLSKW